MNEVPLDTVGKLSLNPKYTFDSFVVGKSNQLAYNTALDIITNLGHAHNPFLVFGGAGVGKTHLLHAICHEILSKNPDMRVLYVSSEMFINELIYAVMNGNLASFQKKYRIPPTMEIQQVKNEFYRFICELRAGECGKRDNLHCFWSWLSDDDTMDGFSNLYDLDFEKVTEKYKGREDQYRKEIGELKEKMDEHIKNLNSIENIKRQVATKDTEIKKLQEQINFINKEKEITEKERKKIFDELKNKDETNKKILNELNNIKEEMKENPNNQKSLKEFSVRKGLIENEIIKKARNNIDIYFEFHKFFV